MTPGGLYPKMDEFLRKSPIRYMVIYQLCSLQMATDELFGAYDMYHFRSDYLNRNGDVCIEGPGGSSFYNRLEDYMCRIFGFQGYFEGKIDPYTKPNINAPLHGIEPGSKAHVDYILNVRGHYDEALVAVFGREFCAKFFDPMRLLRALWPKIAKMMKSMGDDDPEVYSEEDDDGRSHFSLFSGHVDDLHEDDEDDEHDEDEWSEDFDSDDENYNFHEIDDDDDDDDDDASRRFLRVAAAAVVNACR
jgi:hypothetical protein